MNINVVDQAHAERLVLELEGDLDETEALALADRILNLLPARVPGNVVIDLRRCTLLSTQGIAALVSFRLAPELEGCSVTIEGQTNDMERRMLSLKMNRLFQWTSP
jgi:anti-anti-sigma factor